MGYRYIGGPAFIVDAPRHDLTEDDYMSLPADVREAIRNSPMYQPAHDRDVQPVPPVRVLDAPVLSRIFVVTPTKRLEPETVASLFALKWSGALDYYLTRDNPYPPDVRRGFENILHNLTKARKVFLAGNYDAMFVIESDMIVPADALERLSRIDAGVVGGLYFMRHGPNGTPNAYAFDQARPESIDGTIQPRDIARGKPMRTNGVCLGATLIRRDVVKKIAFRLPDDNDTAAPDWAFMQDCNRAGVATICDPTVKCGHIRPDGVALWPMNDGYGREEALRR